MRPHKYGIWDEIDNDETGPEPFARFDLGGNEEPYTHEPNTLGPIDQELTPGEKLGLILTGAATAVGFTAAEVFLLIFGIFAVPELGPVGVVVDLAIVVPSEVLLVDLEIGIMGYIQESVATGTREGHKVELTLIPALWGNLKQFLGIR